MAKPAKNSVSPEVIREAEVLAKKFQSPGQTKEQTKQIEQGIRKGIQEYKKLHKAQVREQDKLKKKQAKEKSSAPVEEIATESPKSNPLFWLLPWALLIASWVWFLSFAG